MRFAKEANGLCGISGIFESQVSEAYFFSSVYSSMWFFQTYVYMCIYVSASYYVSVEQIHNLNEFITQIHNSINSQFAPLTELNFILNNRKKQKRSKFENKLC